MNKVLIESIQQSDGRYLSDAELRPLAQFVASYESRFTTYMALRAEGEALVLKTLRRLMQTQHRKTIQEHGSKCQRDMVYTLQCIAKAILLDNAAGFVEEYVLWMQNITRALHKEDSAIESYRALQQEIAAVFSPEGATLVNGYLDQLIQAFTDGM
jgi:hypothetical protein